MSYILDALKKLEQEKARKAKTPGTISIAGELFAEARPVRYRNGGRTAALAILVAVVVTFGITWYLLKGTTTTNSGPVSAPAVSSAVVAPAVIPVQPQTPSQSPIQLLVPPVQHQPVVLKQQLAVQLPDDQDSGEGEEPLGRSIQRKSKGLNTAPKTVRVSGVKSSPQLATPPADIQVSGVAWQDERAMRRAVVNGLLLKEGTTVSGAQLKEILPDRVRFERSGTQFEVPFVSSSPLAGK